jgi:DNA repair protein RecN (Recombination protein N)
MLASLRIRNLALVEDLSWELGPGLNILTGETGAGKSILIDAFKLLLGERADRTMIRDGATECVVEGMIQAPEGIRDVLGELGLEAGEGGELLLKRSFSTAGQNRQFINGSPVTLAMLKRLGDHLVDLHGPHDHQSLLSTDAQLAALDAFGRLEVEAEAVRAAWDRLRRAREQLDELRGGSTGDMAQRLDFLAHQIEEIEQAAPKLGEDAEVDAAYRAASHAQRIAELAGGAVNTLAEAEGSVLELLARVQKWLQEWQGFDPAAESLARANAGIVVQVRELQADIQARAEAVDLDPRRLAELERRLNTLQLLKRKYGGTLEAVLERLESLRAEHGRLAHFSEHEAALEEEIRVAQAAFESAAAVLSQARARCAPKLAAAVAKQLKALGFKQSEFNIELARRGVAGPRGTDAVEFQFAPNPGEAARPLRAIASSGEMARVMLALKSVLAEQDEVPILIFDEVDANVGGETAVAVGERLRALARSHQVLCITHLPQVAAAGQRHFRVEKKVVKGRTVAQLDELKADERLDELGRMLGGANASARKLAGELLEHYQS